MKKGRISRYKKKKGSKKFFLGGLMKGIASITPIGITAKLIKGKRDEAEKQKEADARQGGGKGKLMTVKVVSGGDGSKNDGELQDKINEKKEAQSSDDGSVKSGAAAGIMKKGGKVKLKKKSRPFKKSGMKAKYEDGGKIDASNVSIHKGNNKPDKDFLKIDKNKLRNDSSASVDTNRQQKFISNRQLNQKNKMLKQQEFDRTMNEAKNAGGTIDAPKHVRDVKSAALMNPISALYAGPAQAVQHKQQKNREKNKEARKGAVVKKYKYGGNVNEGEISKKKKRKYIKSTNKNYAKSLEYDILSNSGVLYSQEGTRKMKRVLKAKEESLYRKTGKKPPKRNMF
mgnify:CR=1 FL=1|tara:strand:- start:1323 stop:2348 length:1026 start_codon:yes stop_codon:yes gene_type:complete